MSADLAAMLQQAGALRRAGRLAEAAEAYERLLAQWPDLPESWYNLAWVQRRLGRYEAALASYGRALELGVSSPEEARLNRGVVYADHLLRPEAAEAEYREALALKPDYWQAHFNLGNLHEDRGDRAKAREEYGRVLELNPNALEALARLANLAEVAGPGDPLAQRLETALARKDVSLAERASLGFALGRALDAAGDFERAFAAYEQANAVSRQSGATAGARPYDRDEHEAFVDRIIQAFPAAAACTQAARGRTPVFICGMFRSGSTLAEQVLAGHPRVAAGGELDFVPRLVRTELALFPEAVAGIGETAFERFANEYARALDLALPGADIVTDKRPDNFLYIGLIKRLYPDAKIVHTRRHALDNVLSVYFLHLDQSMSYASDLMDIAHYYRQERRLMSHWRTLYPDDIVEFDYDAFVREPRRTTERLLAALGLDWSEECLAFHRRSNVVKTASVWQVREPLYQRASGRWRNYASKLEGVQVYLADLLAGE